MRLIDLNCSACGADMRANADLKKVSCPFCGKEMLIDEETTIVKIKNGFEYGYEQERGRLKAQEDYNREQKEKENRKKAEQAKKEKEIADQQAKILEGIKRKRRKKKESISLSCFIFDI